MILLKIMLRGKIMLSPQSSILRQEMLSGPYALFTLRLFMISKTIFRCIIIVSKFVFEIWVKIGRVLSFKMGLV